MSWCFAVTAMLIFPIILIFIFRLQTKYRDELQSDPYYYRSRKDLYDEQLKTRKSVSLKQLEKWLK